MSDEQVCVLYMYAIGTVNALAKKKIYSPNIYVNATIYMVTHYLSLILPYLFFHKI